MSIFYIATTNNEWILLIKKAYGKAAYQVLVIDVTRDYPVVIKNPVEEYFVNDPTEAATYWLGSQTTEPIRILEMRKF